jgi:hypothetical protein
VTTRPYRASICLIDTCSSVRHLGFDLFSAIGYDVNVFYSPETFVNSGATASVDILILGHMRMCLTENETLRWVGAYRPNIKTIMLGNGPALVHRLPDLFHTPSIATVHEKSLDRIVRLRRALHLFCDSRRHTNATSYRTIKHRLATKTCADTSIFMSMVREVELTIVVSANTTSRTNALEPYCKTTDCRVHSISDALRLFGESGRELLYGAAVTHSHDNRIRNYLPSHSEPSARRMANILADEINDTLQSVTNLLYIAESEVRQVRVRLIIGEAMEELAKISRIVVRVLDSQGCAVQKMAEHSGRHDS